MLRLVKNTYLIHSNISTVYFTKSRAYVLNNIYLKSYLLSSSHSYQKQGGKAMLTTSTYNFNNNKSLSQNGDKEEIEHKHNYTTPESINNNTFSTTNINDNENNNKNDNNNDSNEINEITTPKTEDKNLSQEGAKENLEDLEENIDDFLTTIFGDMEPYMNTYNVYTELRDAGFTPSQADEIINLLAVQLNAKLSKLSTKYSQNYELENERYLFESAQEELRVDVTRSREQHINELITLINILERDFHIISDELNSDFIQMKNDSQVAINDQKSENTLMSRKMILQIQETNHKITTELNSAMRSEIESLRWHLSRWGIIAILVALFSACTTFYAFKRKTEKKQTKNEFVPLVIYEPSEFDEDDYHTDLDKSIIA